MWKWIVRILGVVVVLIICAGYWGYRKYKQFTAAGNTATISIGAPVEWVFAALANTDSISVWMGGEATVGSARHGVLKLGDTLLVNTAHSNGATRSSFAWTVTDIRPNQLIAMEVRNDSGKVFATRRDSLATKGDSTLIISTLESPMLDSARERARDSARKGAGAMIDFGTKLTLSAFRLQSENELNQLKAHIEKPTLPRER